MRFTMLAGKLHRATVTDANLDYEGSITVDPDLLEAAGIPNYAQVQIYNITNGERFETYTMPGERGSREVVINAHHLPAVHPCLWVFASVTDVPPIASNVPSLPKS